MFRSMLMMVLCVFSAALFAGDKGERKMGKMMEGPGQEFEFIKKHDEELDLTSEQKKKIDALQEKAEKTREKMKDDPDTRKLFTEIKEARKGNDEAKLQELQGKVREMMQKQTGGEPIMGELRNILTPKQLIKLKELREGEGMKGPRERRKEKMDGGAEKTQERPDPAKGAPSLYDNEK
jgi:Spy/CpxP family protein refolding chaperone